jgi:integrase
MLKTLYPVSFRRYSSLAILGPMVDGFSTWLLEQRYNHTYIKQRIWLVPYIEAVLSRRGVQHVSEIVQSDWVACRKSLLRRFPDQTGTTHALEKYLHVQKFLKPTERKVTSAAATYLAAYGRYLETVRGAATSTIQQNSYTVLEFLAHLRIEKRPGLLKTLTINDLEAFVKKISQRLSRASLRSIVGRLRGFLRYLAVRGEIAHGLDRQIDTPRVYQQEQLPRALAWETVQTLLNSIDRSSLVGLRDFTIFLLMATYGLRASDVVTLTLDDIHWRAGKISISQRKTGIVLELPMTDTVGTALHRYLKKAPPPPPFRQIFRRCQYPGK